MSTLLVRLEGVLQAYGDTPQRLRLTTNMEPTKSAVVGMFCQALGRDLSEDVSDLASLVMNVRVDREGSVLRDFHTVMGVPQADESDPPVLSSVKLKQRRKAETVNDVAVIEKERGVMVTHRYYLQDASFLVGLEGDHSLLEKIEEALLSPSGMIWLGRKCCQPSRSLWVEDGLVKGARSLEVLTTYPWSGRSSVEWVRLVVDLGITATTGELRRDWPISLDPSNRRFAPRRVEMRWLKADELPKPPTKPPTKS